MDLELLVQEALRRDAHGDLEMALKLYAQASGALGGMCAADTSVSEARHLLELVDARREDIRARVAAGRLLEEGPNSTELAQSSVRAPASPQVPIIASSAKVFGLREATNFIHEQVVLPARFPELYVKKRRLWNVGLLYGPSECGKTLLLEKTVRMLEPLMPAIQVRLLRCRELVTNAVEGDRLMREALVAAALRQQDGLVSVIILDDIDMLNPEGVDEDKVVLLRNGRKYKPERSRIKAVRAEALHGLRPANNGHYRGFLVVGSTSRPWAMDAGLRRRFDKRVLCSALDKEEAREMLNDLITDIKLAAALEDEFATLAEGKSTRRAAHAISRALKPKFASDFLRTPTSQVIVPAPTVQSCLAVFARELGEENKAESGSLRREGGPDDIRWTKFSW